MFNQHQKVKTNIIGIQRSNYNFIENKLGQILSGQGKSITLGITCLLFALLGYQVDLACYSKYLCQRDYNEFKNLFTFFNVDNKIKYSTFSDIIEDQINENGNIGSLATNYFQDKQEYNNQRIQIQQTQIKQQTLQKVLLIDEIDQLASKNLYGRSYNLGFPITEPGLIKIYDYIWKNRNNNQTCSNVYNLQQYKDLIKKYYVLEEFIKQYIVQLCYGAKNIDTHYNNFNPQVLQGQVGYYEFDQISYSYYKYSTPFVYYKENEINSSKISRINVENQCKIDLQLYCISYSQFIKDINHDYIMGVTGTLQDLDKNMLNYFSEFNIKNLFFSPSIYGKNNLVFKKQSDVIVCDDKDQQYFQLYSESQQEIQPVIIFFTDQEKLDDYKSYLLKEDKYDVNKYQQLIINEEQDYDIQINNATKIGIITLCLNIFGRGSDFKCYNSTINNHGGVIVILTQISELKAEEQQIMMRTARRDQKGMVKFVLNQQDLIQQFRLNKQQIEDWKQKGIQYEEINKLRQKKYKKTILKQKEQAENLLQNHADSKKLIKAFIDGNDENILQYLKKINQF